MVIEINLFWILLFFIIAIFLFLIHNFGGLKLFIDKDKDIANKFLDKFPLVSPEFMNKSSKEQNIENNQEIHEINKRLDNIQYYLDKLNIHQAMTLDEVKNDRPA